VVDDPTITNEISAIPGHSQFQFGTAVNFGSPEIPALTGGSTDPFSTLFNQTSERKWLTQLAFKYWFSMSSLKGALRLTGLAYEPWN